LGRFEFLEFWDDGKEAVEQPGKAAGEAQKADGEGKDHRHYLREAWKCYQEGEYEEALRAYSRALRYDSTLIEAWEGQVRCLLDLEEYREAEIWLKKALGLYPKHAGLLSVSALSQALAARYDSALASSDEALSVKAGTSQFLWIDRGTVLLLRGSDETAQKNFARVLESSEGADWFWLSRLGFAYLQAGKGPRAADLLLQASEKAPAVAWIWYRLGRAYLACHHQPRARKCFEKALELKPMAATYQKALTDLSRRACFIATCLELDEERLQGLRLFTDCMNASMAGQLLCRGFFALSPLLVEVIDRHPSLKGPGRRLLAQVTDMVKTLQRG